MNERIRQLAEEAELRATLLFNKENLEKFAQLIVRECIDIISPYTIRMGRPGEEYLHPIQEIKTHFGVNER